jgi:hypothetical protein
MKIATKVFSCHSCLVEEVKKYCSAFALPSYVCSTFFSAECLLPQEDSVFMGKRTVVTIFKLTFAMHMSLNLKT